MGGNSLILGENKVNSLEEKGLVRGHDVVVGNSLQVIG